MLCFRKSTERWFALRRLGLQLPVAMALLALLSASGCGGLSAAPAISPLMFLLKNEQVPQAPPPATPTNLLAQAGPASDRP
jgi:hypothetical protein